MCSMPWKMDSVISTLHLARLIFKRVLEEKG